LDAEIVGKDHFRLEMWFPMQKCGFFVKVKEIKGLRGGVL
jgi:hypothetical protein